MGRWARWVVLGVGLLALATIAKMAWTDHQDRIVWRQREAVFAGELAEMQQAFPIGTPREVVVSGLHSRYPQFAIGGGPPDVQVWLGKEPSFTFACSFMTPYLEFIFQTDGTTARLTKIERRTTGECL
jgi:hypothetical protein